jgi:hypothetical protein
MRDDGWLLARFPGAEYLTAPGVSRSHVHYVTHAGVSINLPASFRLTVPAGPVWDPVTPVTAVFLQALEGAGVPELAALAGLITAHRTEYEDLVVSEQVLAALGGGV